MLAIVHSTVVEVVLDRLGCTVVLDRLGVHVALPSIWLGSAFGKCIDTLSEVTHRLNHRPPSSVRRLLDRHLHTICSDYTFHGLCVDVFDMHLLWTPNQSCVLCRPCIGTYCSEMFPHFDTPVYQTDSHIGTQNGFFKLMDTETIRDCAR